MTTRAEKVAEAHRLRAAGLKIREIADHMGIALSTAGEYLADPDLSKRRARRELYSQPCVDCGRPTDGSGGYKARHERCAACAAIFQHKHAYWTSERIADAIRDFAQERGRLPLSEEWKSDCAPYPVTSMVQRVFGTWNAAIRAAGFEPRQQAARPSLELCQEIRDRYEAGAATADLAATYGCSRDSILDRVRYAGGRVRTPWESRRLAVAA